MALTRVESVGVLSATRISFFNVVEGSNGFLSAAAMDGDDDGDDADDTGGVAMVVFGNVSA